MASRINKTTCEDYSCEWNVSDGEHSHVGVRPYLRRIRTPEGKIIDGKTGKEVVEEKQVNKPTKKNGKKTKA